MNALARFVKMVTFWELLKGLAITHGIIKQHDGSIDVTSKLGEGTTFTIRLPINHGD